MTFDEAKLLLTMHCCGGTDHNGQRRVLNDGFLLSLRPYRGQLIEKNFHQVMEALVAVGESLRAPQIDRELMSTLYALCFLGRHWALHPRGMLQRNNLIAPPEIARFELWVEVIESTIHALLSGIPLHHSLSAYTAYLIAVGCGDNVEFVIPLLARAVEDVQVAHLTARPVLALGQLGARARSALPALYAALNQSIDLGPEVRGAEAWVEEIRSHIRQAIRQIETATGE